MNSDWDIRRYPPLVSVAMITYGHEKYIAHAIEGVLAQQTNFPFELVIGTDCSQDRTDIIVAEYATKHPQMIRIVSSETNVGSTKNFNRTKAACRGKYIAFCEGDDYWNEPTKLQRQVDIMENNPNIGLVHSEAHGLHVKRGKELKNLHKSAGLTHECHGQKLTKNLILGKYSVHTCTVCCRLDLIKKCIEDFPEFFVAKYHRGDTQLWTLLSTLCDFYYLEEPLSTYRILEESASHSANKEKSLIFMETGVELRANLAEKLLSDKDLVFYIRVSQKCSGMLSLAYRFNDYPLAKKAFQIYRKNNIVPKISSKIRYYSLSSSLVKIVLLPVIWFLSLKNAIVKKYRQFS